MHRIVFVHQHTKSYGRWHLLTGRKIIGQILRDLAGLKDCLTHIGFLHSHIFNHIQKTDSHRSAYIQLPVLRRQHGIRIFHKSFHIRFCICGDGDAPKRPISLDLQRQNIRVILHHTSHHSACRKKTPKSSRCHRAGIMAPSRLLDQISRRRCECTHLPISCCCSYNIILHILTLLSVYFSTKPEIYFLIFPFSLAIT